jgi:hypothetical protein
MMKNQLIITDKIMNIHLIIMIKVLITIKLLFIGIIMITKNKVMKDIMNLMVTMIKILSTDNMAIIKKAILKKEL